MIENVINQQKNSIYSSTLFLKSVLFFLVEPDIFMLDGVIHTIHFVYIGFRISIFVLLFSLYISNWKSDKTLIWIIAYYGYFMLDTFRKGGDINRFINFILPSVCLCLIFIIWLEENPNTLIESFSLYYFFCILNFITILIFPEGMYEVEGLQQNWFFGYKNYHIWIILPVLCMTIIGAYKLYGHLTLKCWILMVIALLSQFICHCDTGIVALILFYFCLIFLRNFSTKLFKLSFVWLVVIVFTYFLTQMINISIINFVFNDIFKKSVSLNGRYKYWAKAVYEILKDPIFGKGYLTSYETKELLRVSHPHNYVLYLLFFGGVILFLIMTVGLFLAQRGIEDVEDSIYGKVVLYTLFAFLVMGMDENIANSIFLVPLIVFAMKLERIESYDAYYTGWIEFTYKGKIV